MSAPKGPRSPWKTRYFLDTEFTDFKDAQLISLAIVGEDGREFYAERSDYDQNACSAFVRQVVVPQLGQFPGRSMPAAQMTVELMAWLQTVPLKPKPVLAYDYPGDVDLLWQLLGGPLPRGWALENVSQKINGAQLASFQQAHGGEHHALHDARANCFAFI